MRNTGRNKIGYMRDRFRLFCCIFDTDGKNRANPDAGVDQPGYQRMADCKKNPLAGRGFQADGYRYSKYRPRSCRLRQSGPS